MTVQTVDRTACRRVACDGVNVDAAPARVLLLPWGDVVSDKGDFLIDDESAAAMVAAFSEHGTDLPIDYEHQTLGGEYARADGTAPAAGWIRRLEVVPRQGIFGTVEWTARGRELIAAREYRYLSPVVEVRQSDKRAVGLHSAAMTNKPAIVGMRPIANKVGEGELARENGMLKTTLAAMHFREAQRAFFGWPPESADAGTRTIAASSGRGTSYAPAIPTQSPEDQRQDVIAHAAQEYVREADGKMVVCSQRSWVDQALRDANMPTLAASEVRDLALSEQPQGTPCKPAFVHSVNTARAAVETLPLAEQRPAIICDANAKFYADETIRKVCSMRAWCNNALREADMQPLTEDETREYSIQVDD